MTLEQPWPWVAALWGFGLGWFLELRGMARRSLQRYLFELCIALLLLLYVGTYICLTLQGRYVHIVYGASGPKRPDRWAPLHFEQNGDLNDGAMYFFAPLYLADIKLWHRDDYNR